jgi:hypothetical protein
VNSAASSWRAALDGIGRLELVQGLSGMRRVDLLADTAGDQVAQHGVQSAHDLVGEDLTGLPVTAPVPHVPANRVLHPPLTEFTISADHIVRDPDGNHVEAVCHAPG